MCETMGFSYLRADTDGDLVRVASASNKGRVESISLALDLEALLLQVVRQQGMGLVLLIAQLRVLMELVFKKNSLVTYLALVWYNTCNSHVFIPLHTLNKKGTLRLIARSSEETPSMAK